MPTLTEMSNIFAHTAPGASYPEFISINRTVPGFVDISVRSCAKPDGACGDQAYIRLTEEQFKGLIASANANPH